jgi:hypothetical protein
LLSSAPPVTGIAELGRSPLLLDSPPLFYLEDHPLLAFGSELGITLPNNHFPYSIKKKISYNKSSWLVSKFWAYRIN